MKKQLLIVLSCISVTAFGYDQTIINKSQHDLIVTAFFGPLGSRNCSSKTIHVPRAPEGAVVPSERTLGAYQECCLDHMEIKIANPRKAGGTIMVHGKRDAFDESCVENTFVVTNFGQGIKVKLKE